MIPVPDPARRPSLLSRVRARVIGRQVSGSARVLDVERCPGSGLVVHDRQRRAEACPHCGEVIRVTDRHSFYAHDRAPQ